MVRRGLVDHAAGRTITGVTVHDVRSLRRHAPGPDDFVDRLVGRTIAGAARRGKYLWLPLDEIGPGGDAVLCHLGMSGQFRVSDPAAEPTRHQRIVLDLDDGQQLRFADQRIFGGMAVSEDLLDTGAIDGVGGSALPREIAHIARDPLDPAFDAAAFTARLRRRETGIKRALLDQSLISGVGNIYADESLWRTPLHFARNTRHLRTREIDALLGHVVEVMVEALAQGGTSFDALYVNVNGASGYFSRSLDVYGREGHPCKRCGSPIVREPFMNRSSHFCSICQRIR